VKEQEDAVKGSWSRPPWSDRDTRPANCALLMAFRKVQLANPG
jgi:hypothetical protein